MGRKLWEKEKFARYEQFLLFPQCFQKACVPGASKGVIVWEWVNESNTDRPPSEPKFNVLVNL